MNRDEKLIVKILQFLNDKGKTDSSSIRIYYDTNTIVEQLEFCLKEDLIFTSKVTKDESGEVVFLENITLSPKGKKKIKTN